MRLAAPLAAALALAGAGAAAGQDLPHAWAIGHRDITFVDASRGNREIPADVYYPAAVAGEGVPVAPPADGVSDAGFPVLAFGHGFLLPVTLYGWVWQGLVPDGYVVALPRTGGELFPSHADFALDLAFVAAELRAAAGDPASPFFGRTAGTAAVLGHSMGGGCSLLAAAGDPSITAVANLAAADTNPSAIAACDSVTAPALLFSGSLDCVTPPAQHQAPMWSALASPLKLRATITGATHCQFNANSGTCNLGELFCSGATIGAAQQQAKVLELLRPFLAFTLKGDGFAWTALAGKLAAPQGFTLQQAAPPLPAPSAVGGLDFLLAGDVVLTGTALGAVTGAEVDDVPVPVAGGATALALSLPAAAQPGPADLSLSGSFGTWTAPGAVARWPALRLSPAVLGQPLTLRVELGAEGWAAILWALDDGGPTTFPGSAHALLLDAFNVLLILPLPPGGALDLSAPLPADPALEGLRFLLQGWTRRTSDGARSFSNAVTRVVAG